MLLKRVSVLSPPARIFQMTFGALAPSGFPLFGPVSMIYWQGLGARAVSGARCACLSRLAITTDEMVRGAIMAEVRF